MEPSRPVAQPSRASLPPVAGRRGAGKAERTRARLLRAAEEVFGERGYHEASIAEMTQRAGIALGTFYVHFPSKKAIFEQLMGDRTEELRDALRSSVAGLDTAREREEARVRAFFEWVAERPSTFRVARQCEYIDAKLAAEWNQAFLEDYATSLSRAMDAGEIPRADPVVLAACVIGMTDFVATRFLEAGWSLELDPGLVEGVLAVTTRAIGCRDDHAAAS